MRKPKKSVIVLALLLPCFAVVSCGPPTFTKLRANPDVRAKERNIAVSDLRSEAGDGFRRYTMTIDCPDADNFSGANLPKEKPPIQAQVSHELGKCVVSWDIPSKRFFAQKSLYYVVITSGDGSELAFKVKPHATSQWYVTAALVSAGLLACGVPLIIF